MTKPISRLFVLMTLGVGGCSGTIDDGDDSSGAALAPAPAAPSSGAVQPDPAAPGTHPASPLPGAAMPGAGPQPPASGSPPAPPAADATPPPQTGRRGIFDCPTVPYPGGAPVAAPDLSSQFQKVCGSCHGASGEGQGKYPAIPGTLDEATFIAKTRKGTENMPPFSSEFISDAALVSDFRALKARAGARTGAAGAHPAFSWTQAQVDERYRAGLAMWRKPDSHGAACASCHSPDAIDLAVIGYPDHAIMRRGLMHLQANDVLQIIDFVHAQRRRFGITEPCSPDWRPFQPGGEPLPGATMAEQDLALFKELQKRNVLIATSRIVTLDDARKAMAQLGSLDLRRMPLGIPLPRWTEDRFNGKEHRSANEWIAVLPRVPRDPAAWYALEDRYLANPTVENVFALINQSDRMTTDGGYGAGNSSMVGNCRPEASTARSWTVNASKRKRSSNLLGQHYFRMALLNKEGWYELPQAPFPTNRSAFNPFTTLAAQHVEPPCYGESLNAIVLRELPSELKAEIEPMSSANSTWARHVETIGDPWFTIGQIFDQGMMQTPTPPFNALNYWSVLHLPRQAVHEPFLYAHRVAVNVRYHEQMRGTAAFPVKEARTSSFTWDRVHPLLTALGIYQVRINEVAGGDNEALLAANVRLRGNIIRMFLLIQRDLLQKGAMIESRSPNSDFCNKLPCQMNKLSSFASRLERVIAGSRARNALAGLVDDGLYTTGLMGLHREVMALIEKAPELYPSQ